MTTNTHRGEGAATRPPAAPWLPLKDTGRGYLSVYFSDEMARWPVRRLTKPGDNKSDPNIETGTYGLFSTCEPPMRNRIVKDGAASIFFVATPKRNEGRVLAGYYHVGWYTEGTQGAINADYALAASCMRFIDPIRLSDLPPTLAEFCAKPFRQMRPAPAETTADLRAVIDSKEDRTQDYIAEIRRIERFARDNSDGGYAYPSWGRTEGFDWNDADTYYRQEGQLSKVRNSSPTDKWRCRECSAVVENSALLKRCPSCGKTATLAPETDIRA
jgi:hypothetical protein